MNMFESFLASIPSNRSELVNDLEIPEIPLTPYIWEPDPISDSSLDTVTVEEEPPSLSTDSSMALSRAMTDSDIDYDWYPRYKRLDLTDPWEQMRIRWAAFPPDHIDTLSRLSLQSYAAENAPDYTYTPFERFPTFPSQELLRRAERFIEEECCVYGPDDPGLLELDETLQELNLESLYSDLDVIL